MACRKCLQGTPRGPAPKPRELAINLFGVATFRASRQFSRLLHIGFALEEQIFTGAAIGKPRQRGFPRDRLGGTALNFGHLPVNELHSTDFK